MRAPHPVHGPFTRSVKTFPLRLAAWTILACLATHIHAQQGEPPPPGTPMYTLHVYTNLVQVPTLVLNPEMRPLPPLTKDQFTITIDSGPKFRPTQIHLEGDDPIILGVLLDTSGSEEDLIRSASTAIASFATRSLKPRDRVAIFAFDCSVVASPKLLDPNPADLRAATEDLLKTTSMHGRKKSDCYHRGQVWNYMASVVNALTKFSGRRVLVAVTDAFDNKSNLTRAQVQQFATNFSTSIFTVDYDRRVHNPIDDLRNRALQTDLQSITSGTGGIILQTTPTAFANTLQNIVTLLRGRYIIEFPRPSNNSTGSHIIDVRVPKKDAVVLPAGVSVPLPGDKELNDPDNVPSDPTRAPTIGTQKKKSR
jgi:VWFA-related protein